MKLFVGLDVSLEKTAICVISEHGKIVREAQATSEPEPLARRIGVILHRMWVEDADFRADGPAPNVV